MLLEHEAKFRPAKRWPDRTSKARIMGLLDGRLAWRYALEAGPRAPYGPAVTGAVDVFAAWCARKAMFALPRQQVLCGGVTEGEITTPRADSRGERRCGRRSPMRALRPGRGGAGRAQAARRLYRGDIDRRDARTRRISMIGIVTSIRRDWKYRIILTANRITPARPGWRFFVPPRKEAGLALAGLRAIDRIGFPAA